MDKPLVILSGEIKTPPLSERARRWAGYLLRSLQQGLDIGMPDSRAMPGIGPACHELRINDVARRVTWRIIYRIDTDAIVIAEVFAKKTQRTPIEVIRRCQQRFARYDQQR